MKTLACRDVGYSCDYVARGETEEEVLQKGVEHGRKEHGLKQEDRTPELKQKRSHLLISKLSKEGIGVSLRVW